ncbi:MAG TPA: response regulator transcription factor [Anaerolineaceae bacterium]|nr:response regulator transcription factor [Anaerolineaceae bacterium]
MIDLLTNKKEYATQSVGIDLDETLRRNKKVLIVDDDPDTVELVKRILRLSDFDVASARNGFEAISITEQLQPDIILLDLMMPEIDGKATLKKIREISHAPILILSALIEKENIVELLNLGGDDYVTKPFHRDELIARIQAVLRRTKLLSVIDGVSIPEIGLTVNFSKREVSFQGHFVQLSPKEYELIELISKRIPHIVKYEDIAIELWGEKSRSSKNRIKFLVHSIRNKFNEINSDVEVIINASRIGYRIKTD